MAGSLVALGVLLGIVIAQAFAASRDGTQSKAAACQDTRLGEIAAKLEADPASSARLGRAVAGDANSALDLAVMFGKIDFGTMMCFERMAAENGGKVSQSNYGKYLMKSDEPLVRARGQYWMAKAGRPGNDR
ncbi:hypothetical protein [Lysobacter enzymogenes]|nr:hypothetical protein [Lysobacter enzymogenes]